MKKIIFLFSLISTFNLFSQYVVDSVDLNQFWYDSSVVDNQIW